MRTSEVLYGAADHIERYGHHKGSGYADTSDIRHSPACSIGAINLAVIDLNRDDAEIRHMAQDAIRDYLGQMITDWNDAPERTAEQVIEVLRRVALVEQVKEAETSHVVTTSPHHVRIVAARHNLELVEVDGYLLATLFVPALGEALVYQARVAVTA